MRYDFEDINDILADLADREIVENPAEPIDCNDCHPMDWAEVTGLLNEVVEEIYPEILVDENGSSRYLS